MAIDGTKLLCNTHMKKRTHLLLIDDDTTGRFVDIKTVVVKETIQGYTFTVKTPKVHTKKTMTVVIHSAQKTKKTKYSTSTDGMLAVTITTMTTTLPDVMIPVVLIADDTGCDG